YRLSAGGFDTCRVLSVAGACYREVMFNSRDKNDPKDAHGLLQLPWQGITQHYVDPLIAGHHDIQELSETYCHMTLS
ncbi:MAG: IS110 family transposase, partial [Proteobacteria bacterium]|nr:IS110 family transposase [Pseudomonadota bacterium]